MAEILCWRISKEIKGIHKKKYKISYLHFGGEKETRVWKGSEGQRDLDSNLIQSIQPAKIPCTGTCFLSPCSHNCLHRTLAQIIKHMFLRALTSFCLPVGVSTKIHCSSTTEAILLNQDGVSFCSWLETGNWLKSVLLRVCFICSSTGAFSQLSFLSTDLTTSCLVIVSAKDHVSSLSSLTAL